MQLYLFADFKKVELDLQLHSIWLVRKYDNSVGDNSDPTIPFGQFSVRQFSLATIQYGWQFRVLTIQFFFGIQFVTIELLQIFAIPEPILIIFVSANGF